MCFPALPWQEARRGGRSGSEASVTEGRSGRALKQTHAAQHTHMHPCTHVHMGSEKQAGGCLGTRRGGAAAEGGPTPVPTLRRTAAAAYSESLGLSLGLSPQLLHLASCP